MIMQTSIWWLALACVIVAAGEVNAEPTKLVAVSAETIGQYGAIQLDLETSIQPGNPFDADEIRLDAEFTTPAGRTVFVPCFYVRREGDFDNWQCRFTPSESGNHSVCVRTSGRGLGNTHTTGPRSFVVEPSEERGFVRLNQDNSYEFVFDNGSKFRGVGENLGWEPRRGRRGTRWSYDDMLPKLQQHGCNLIRTWMCPWNLTLEWKKAGLGRYDEQAAQRLDELLALAKQHDVYVILVFDYHGQLRTTPDHWGANDEWKNNPYNKALGGPCQTPTDFFTHQEARRHYRNRLRYLVARWGYHPNLLAWELWNEVDIVMRNEKVPADAILQWHREMSGHLAELDPFDHVITTSVSSRFPPTLWELPRIEITMLHLYGPTQRIPGELSKAVHRFAQPAVVSEFAYSWKSPGELKNDVAFEEELHLGLWRGMFSPTPILPMTWWWEFHDKSGHWNHFRAAAAYCLRMCEAEGRWTSLEVNCSPLALECRAMKVGNTTFVWLYNSGDSSVKKASITMDAVNAGTLQLESWSTTGQEKKDDMPPAALTVDAEADQVVLEISELQPKHDLAFILE
jgi:hypothetical protein